MKYVVLVPDGASDYPLKELNNKTPLQVADMPNIRQLASSATFGLAQTIPDGFSPGSDVANLSILGYDPHLYYCGRGPLEAAYHGINIGTQDTVFRCNLITVKNGLIEDYSASHIDSEAAAGLIKVLDEELGSDEVKFYPGVSYRHLTVFKNKQLSKLKTTAPHDALGQPIQSIWPKGEGSKVLIELMRKAAEILKDHPINQERQAKGLNPANMIWFWGSGQKKELPAFNQRFGLNGGVISAVDLIKGIAVAIGLEAVDVAGATGYFDTDYEAKAANALEVLQDNDFVYVHVEAPDEAGHTANIEEKVKALENFDKRLVSNMLSGLDMKNTRIMLLPDHATPIEVRTHTNDKVPFLVYPGSNQAHNFDEKEVESKVSMVLKGHELMPRFVKGELN